MANGVIIPNMDGDCYNNPVKIGMCNGKTLYKIVLPVPATAADTLRVVDSSGRFVSKTLVNISGCLLQTDGSVIQIGYYYDSTSYSASFITTVNGSLYVKAKQAISSGLVVVEYTD